MKISDMLKREDIYGILEKTLHAYVEEEKICGKSREVKEFLSYPHLNAIITSNPSALVKKYLTVEYQIKSNIFKMILVKTYLALLLNGHGFMAERKINIINSWDVSNDILIYPCNKKIKIFDFNKKCIDTWAKFGFSSRALRNEVIFRGKYLANFILPIEYSSDRMYREKIIDGIPLARITKEYYQLKQKAYELLWDYFEDTKRELDFNEYMQILKKQIVSYINSSFMICENNLKERLMEFTDRLINQDENNNKVKLGMSHGDFHDGNIWVENQTQRIIIIDWESWGERSIWYDRIILNTNIRNNSNYKNVYQTMLCEQNPDFQVSDFNVFLLEDILYKCRELEDFPLELRCAEFWRFIYKAMESMGEYV